MQITTLSDFRQNMKKYFEQILSMHKPLFIKRPKGGDLVVLSKSDYDSLQETFYLMKSPKNASRLIDAVEADRKGQGSIQIITD